MKNVFDAAAGFAKAAIAVLMGVSAEHAFAAQTTVRDKDGDRSASLADCILYITGASDLEDLDEETVEHFHSLAGRPLKINCASRTALISSGLFSQYQAASLVDYRAAHGDVLSEMELASVDGFGGESARALKPFVSFYSPRNPGEKVSDSRSGGALLLRAQARNESLGAKFKYYSEGAAEAALSARRLPGANSASFYGLFRTGNGRARIIAGDFNARFGQGLSLWTGFSLSSLSNVSSFYKRTSGFSPSWSFSSSSLRGLAGDVSVGRLVLSSFVAFPKMRAWMEEGKPYSMSLLPGGNLSWYFGNGQFGVTLWGLRGEEAFSSAKVSSDFRFNVKGMQFIGEGSWDAEGKSAAFLCGCAATFAGKRKLAVLARYYPEGFDPSYSGAVRGRSMNKDEAGVSIGAESGRCTMTFDGFRKLSADERTLRAIAESSFDIGKYLSLKLKAKERLRNFSTKYTSDIRCDLAVRTDPFLTTVRGEWTFSSDLLRGGESSSGFLSYAEEGVKKEKWFSYLRATFFRVDSWENRIYSYERDAPGNFLVPAWYGRGYSVSLYSGGTVAFRKGRYRPLKLYMRGSAIRYPFMAEPKKPAYDLRFQAQYSF